jgi:alkylhydroperoxidase/carboxymuconolactone decarboxylase family protein YurZ
MAIKSGAAKTLATDQPANPWGSSLDKFKEWDPKGAELLLQVGTNPWTSGVLPRKEVELISLALNCACTNLDEAGTRRHIRGALDAGATRDEILTVLKMASLLALHSCSLGAPILLEEAKAAGVEPRSKNKVPTPVCDKAREVGQWNTAWDPFLNLDPLWTEQVISAGLPVYTGALIPPKLAELLSIAFDASITHMYAPGTRRHIKAALKLGATIEEIMEVLKLCVAMGVQASAKGVAILAEELQHNSAKQKAGA